MNEPGAASVAGIVLAGGRSRRFGRDKLTSTYRGRPLLGHAVSRLREVCGRVIVVLGHDAADPFPPAERVAFVRDETPDEGPLRGLEAGLAAADCRWVVVAGGDMPDLQADVLREMLRALRETEAAAAALSDGGEARPLPCALTVGPASRAARELLAAGRRSLRDLFGTIETVVVDEPTWTALDPERRTLIDIDEPADLKARP